MKALEAVKEYQCAGCVGGHDTTCYESKSEDVECTKHVTGTMGCPPVGRFLLGLPIGFNRIGNSEGFKISIVEKYSDRKHDKFNIPVWKHLDRYNNTLVRGLMPRLNLPFLHIYLENCMDKIDCLEITKNDIEKMD